MQEPILVHVFCLLALLFKCNLDELIDVMLYQFKITLYFKLTDTIHIYDNGVVSIAPKLTPRHTKEVIYSGI